MMEENREQEKKIKNPTLFKLFKELSMAFIVALDKPFFSSYGSGYDRVKALIQGDTELVAKILEKRPDLEEGKLSRCLVSAKKCLKALLEEDICREPPHASTDEGYLEELTLFLEELFKEIDHLRTRALFATPEAFDRHLIRILTERYLRYENYLYDVSVSGLLICEFQNFRCSKNLEVGNRMSIRGIEQEEFHRLVEAGEKYGFGLESYPEFVLRMPVNNENWQKNLMRLITALRLLKKERIGLLRVYYASALPCRSWIIVEAPAGTKIVEKPTESLFNLSVSDEDELKRLWILLDRVKEVGYLTASMQRFNFAYERERLQDRWIDYFISLESLYSKADEATEVRHRLATRTSLALVHGSLEDRKAFRAKIKDWYTIRSKIVHGMQANLSPEQLQDLEEVLRKSLNWFMSHKDYSDHDKIIDLLDLQG